MWAFILFGKWILFRVPRELFLVAFAQATIWAEYLLDQMKYRLRLAARQHRPPTGHAGNEKEAKGQVSWTGKVQCKINNGNPSGHRCGRETAYDIMTEPGRQHISSECSQQDSFTIVFPVCLHLFPMPSLQPIIRNRRLRTICIHTSEGSEALSMPAEAHARTSHLKAIISVGKEPWRSKQLPSPNLQTKICYWSPSFLGTEEWMLVLLVAAAGRDAGLTQGRSNRRAESTCSAHGMKKKQQKTVWRGSISQFLFFPMK